ncbi:PIG-L deacetylase family protein [Oceanicella sp. SM1341]|uniref:PIG-L deacetylase family protein n=1 Tax=Oceanicella sp. SM1341 TaxID=1548889 RepID=UPI000E526092|nr:PIG-L family deacetylase [Oceanicella sp. SM1341]
MSTHDCGQPCCRACLLGDAPVLVLAPHPDDETLGCGALLAAAFAGPGAHVACMTDGAASHTGAPDWPGPRLARLRAHELRTAVARLGGGAADVSCLGAPDTRLRCSEALVDRVCDLAQGLGARHLFATAAADPHCDHQATAALARRVAARLGLRLFFYPVWSRWKTPERPVLPGAAIRHRLAVAPARRRKAHALAAHRSQRGRVVEGAAEGFEMPRGFMRLFLEQDEHFYEAAR